GLGLTQFHQSFGATRCPVKIRTVYVNGKVFRSYCPVCAVTRYRRESSRPFVNCGNNTHFLFGVVINRNYVVYSEEPSVLARGISVNRIPINGKYVGYSCYRSVVVNNVIGSVVFYKLNKVSREWHIHLEHVKESKPRIFYKC